MVEGRGCKAVLSISPPTTQMNSALLGSARLILLGAGEDPKLTCNRVLIQGIRGPSSPFPITMTASGLSPEDRSEQLLPRKQETSG